MIETCASCVCRYCLFFWSGRYPYGGCYDDYRAEQDPYTDHYPERGTWSDWDKPGEQEHWCRGGSMYPAYECRRFVQYTGQRINQCARANVQEFQDGFVICPIRNSMSCEECMKGLTEKLQGGTIT